MPQDLAVLNELKERVVELLNEATHAQAAEAYQNCINLIDDMKAELNAKHA